MKIGVLGAGAWGTALASLLVENGHEVLLWGHRPDRLAAIAEARTNHRLPGIVIPETLEVCAELDRLRDGRDCLVFVVPSKAMRIMAGQVGDYRGLVISATKGIEFESGLTMTGVLKQTLSGARAAALSGPTLALEVARGIPSAVVAAADNAAQAEEVQAMFHRPAFRVYTSTDLLGVELGGALKNVIAIAAGVCDGLGFGDNAKAAMITRAIVEMGRLGVACGANAETFSGLSGLGDLVVTCCSKLSRNRRFGERIGGGETLEHILATSDAVAEGHPTARSAYHLARRLNVETPIIDEVYGLLYEGKSVRQALRELMGRDSKAELEA